MINPNGVASSSGVDTPHRTQPRWGKMFRSTRTQGSRCPATLGFGMESRWDKTGWDKTGWDKTGWDESGWNESGWNESGWINLVG